MTPTLRRAAMALALSLSLAVGSAAVGCSLLGPSAEKPSRPGRVRKPRPPKNAVFVAPNGDDEASGREDAPLRSIQAAVEKATPGRAIVLRQGTYEERPDFSQAATAEKPIRVEPYPGEPVVLASGFDVSGSHYRIRNLTITPGTRSDDHKAQIHVYGSHNVLDGIVQRDTYGSAEASWDAVILEGERNLVSDIDFRGCGAIVARGSRNVFRGGTIHHTGGSLALLEGEYATLERLDMHDPGQVDRSGNAADAINLNAAHVTIRGNRIYNVFLWDPDQHPDAIQWWNVADDLVIEGNVIGSQAVGGALGQADNGHIQFETGGSADRVVIRNNVFLGTHGPFVIRSSVEQTVVGRADDWQIVGNTFLDDSEIRGDMLANFRNLLVANNVFAVSGRLERGPGAVYDYNAYLGVPKNPTDGPHSIRVSRAALADPDVSRSSAWGRRADLRPGPGSPLVGRGISLPSLPRDISGKRRGDPPSIGAYEGGTD